MDRLEGMAKLTGRERYIDDEPIDGIFWGMTVRSPVPRGRIREVRFKKGIDWSKFVIVDHRDVPGRNEVFLIERDQPVLAGTITRHVHEAVLLLAHEDRDLLRRAVRSVEVIVDPEPPVLDFRAPPAPQHVQHGSDNVLKRLLIEKGEVDAALARSPIVVEGEYETGAQEHIYIENQGAQAWVDRGVVVVKGSMQCPYYVLNALKHALARDESRVRVIQSPTGGGFGGKEDYPSIIALHAALLALKAGGRPVRIIYDRSEDMAATTKRHPALIRHRTGVDRDGRLLGQSIDVILDGGAYVTLSPVVLSRGMIHAAGPYFCENVRVTGRAVLTNSVPTGAFRGFGAPQTIFACERHMDVIAARLGLPPEQVRRVNLLRDGQTTATGQTITDGVDRVALMDAALRESRYHERVREFAAFNAGGGPLRRGIGLATFWHGAGFTGGGEVKLASRVRVAGLADGRAEVRSANTEMGQGTTTIFTQIAAARLGFDPADVLVAIPDTARVPNSGPTVASRTAMVVGRLIERACDDVRLKVGLSAHEHGPAVRDAILRWHRAHPGAEPIGEAVYDPPPGIHWDDSTYRGDAYSVFAWATYVAEVEVDVRTFATRVTGFTAVQEIGRVINETLARGQVQGGVVQGVGWAIMEKCTWKNGAMANNSLTNYIIPTSGDVPPIGVRFIEGLNPHGGMGSKGLGELPIDGPAPAILNAVASATGARAAVIPLTPERLMEEVGATWT